MYQIDSMHAIRGYTPGRPTGCSSWFEELREAPALDLMLSGVNVGVS